VLVKANTLLCVKWVWTRTFMRGTVQLGSRAIQIEATFKYQASIERTQVSSIEQLSPELRAIYAMQFA
jgi:hypothetical protein